MSDDEKKYEDPELERFFRENKDMVERLLKEEKEIFSKMLKEKKAKYEDFAKQSDKKKETAQQMMGAFMDPEVQKHFMKMGMEFMMGMSALVQASPIPDMFKDMAGKAESAGKTAADEFYKEPETKKRSNAKPQKVEIKDVGKKTGTATKAPRKSTAAKKDAE